jgi:predicted molibdopterin-dependent oxidoreductase YjgC
MYSRVFPPERGLVTIYIEDVPVRAVEGATVAAAMAEAGLDVARLTAKRYEERGPFCHMGVCFECLMEIDGVPNTQACLTTVREGMRVKRQQGAPSFKPETISS